MIRIITDSAADFSQSELQALSVRCVPMTVSFGEDSYTDGVDLPQEIFWQRMEAGQNPKTSQPSPDAFLREFEAAKDAGDSVVCILISSALSGTMQSALIAAGMVEDLDIALVDSLTATAGQRLLVQEACRLRDAGNESAQDVAAAVRQLVPRIRIAACLDTLSGARRAHPQGRGGSGQAGQPQAPRRPQPGGACRHGGQGHRPPPCGRRAD